MERENYYQAKKTIKKINKYERAYNYLNQNTHCHSLAFGLNHAFDGLTDLEKNKTFTSIRNFILETFKQKLDELNLELKDL